VRFGVFLLAARFPGQHDAAVLDATVAAAVAAEEAGFDDVWVAEHHFMSYGICPSAITLAGYLLGATRAINVGTAVSVLPLAHPIALAEQTLLLDQLGGGRFRLGVGRGGPWIDLTVFGGVHDRQRFAEGLDLLLAALTEPRVAAHGSTYRFPAVDVVPEPRTRPRPEVVLAATTPATVELAAHRQLPLLLGMHADDEEKADLIGRYWHLGGRADHVYAALGHVADTRREALHTMRARLPRWLGPGLAGYRRADGQPTQTRDPITYTELLCRLHPVGTAEDCRKTLAATAARTGLRRVMLMVEGTGEPARTVENIFRFGAEVLPHLR
jgi:alkanesulfonate monooxygenase SsuD/methylene tetrahydromethanopterin reductase-like flavin-dependent oxidoreductase (luciferase family)